MTTPNALSGRALMSVEDYSAFSQLRHTLSEAGVSNIAQTFVPVGPAINDARPRLLYIGRATRGYDDDDDRVNSFERVIARNVEIVETMRSAYWAFMRRIIATAGEAAGHKPDRGPMMSVAWSNLAKLGETKGNPTRLSCRKQQEASNGALRSEIAALQPAAIVLVTGRWQQDVLLDPVFGADGWVPGVSADLRSKIDEPSRALVVHAYHPQGKRGSSDMADTIGSMIVAHLGTKQQVFEHLPA